MKMFDKTLRTVRRRDVVCARRENWPAAVLTPEGRLLYCYDPASISRHVGGWVIAIPPDWEWDEWLEHLRENATPDEVQAWVRML